MLDINMRCFCMDDSAHTPRVLEQLGCNGMAIKQSLDYKCTLGIVRKVR